MCACAAVTCPDTMQYGTCVSSCQRRCSALSVPQRCGAECEEGCVCPQDSFYNHRTRTCVHRYCRRSHALYYLTRKVSSVWLVQLH